MPDPEPFPVRTDADADADGSKPSQSVMAPQVPTAGAESGAERPTYQGDWAKATGQERQAHMQAVAAWKKAQGVKPTPQASSGRNGSVEPSARQHTDTLEAGASADASASLEALRQIRDDKKALRSDRIRAAEALLRSSTAQASSATDEVALWMAMRTTLEAIPPGDALGWLLGELGEVVGGTGHALEEEETRA